MASRGSQWPDVVKCGARASGPRADRGWGRGPFSGLGVTSFPCFIPFGFSCPGPFCGCHRSPLGIPGAPRLLAVVNE